MCMFDLHLGICICGGPAEVVHLSWVFDSAGVGAPNPCVVQGSAVYGDVISGKGFADPLYAHCTDEETEVSGEHPKDTNAISN